MSVVVANTEQQTPYQLHKDYIISYLKRRYNNDDEFRKKIVEKNCKYKKNRMETDEEYRKKILEQGRIRNRRYRIKKKEQQIEEVKKAIDESDNMEDKIRHIVVLGKLQKYLEENK